MVLGEIMREKYVIWGIGANGMNFIDIYGLDGVAAIVDRDMTNKGETAYCGIPIITLESYISDYSSFDLVVTQMDFLGLVNILKGLGIENYHVLRENTMGWSTLSAGLDGSFAEKLKLDRNEIYHFPDQFNYRLIAEQLMRQGYQINIGDKCDPLFEITHMNAVFNARWIGEHQRLAKTKNGSTIFVIGNGPSLSIRDLELLMAKGIPTIASNHIYKIFDETKWRPNYYSISDYECLRQFAHDKKIREKFRGIPKIFSDNYYDYARECDATDVFFYQQIQVFPNVGFSMDIDKGIFSSDTVTYAKLQIAVSLGYSNIYLIGVDNGGTSGTYHFYNEKNNEIEQKNNQSTYEKSEVGFRYAEYFSKKHSFKISNATRGGYLEVFDRVDFDQLFE